MRENIQEQISYYSVPNYLFCPITYNVGIMHISMGNSMICGDIWQTMSDISKLLYIIWQAVRRVKFETIFKYHKWYLCQISLQIMLLFVYTTTRKKFPGGAYPCGPPRSSASSALV